MSDPERIEYIKSENIVEKVTFGSMDLVGKIQDEIDQENLSPSELAVEFVGLCTDICVVSNALLIKANFPEAVLCVDPACCAGVTPDLHEAALKTMESCQIKRI